MNSQKWVCREECYWRDKLWSPGEVTEVFGVEKWAYSGGYWTPVGQDIIESNQRVPRHFEPLDFSVLNYEDDITMARDNVKVPARWKLVPKKEKQKDPPKPLSPEELKKGKADMKPKQVPPSRAKSLVT